MVKDRCELYTEKKYKIYKKKKKIQENKLDIVTQCNMKIVDYLDFTLNLNNSNFKPYYRLDHAIYS